jgi:hypothetical protein
MPTLDREQRRFLERGPQHMYLFVNMVGGDVIAYPMTGIFDRDALWFTTYRAAPKVRHLLADGRVCALCAPPATDLEPGPVLSVRGRAEISADTSAFSRQRDDAPLEVPPETAAKVANRLDSGQRVVFGVRIESARFLSTDQKGLVTCRVPISR